MLFSNPDYPLFLIAVFFLYALSRYGGARGRWARIAIMILLGDLVFLLIAKDPDLLWDPLGNVLYRLAGNYYSDATLPWPVATMALHWVVGLAVIGGAVALGMRAGAWLQSDRGQRVVAVGLVVVVLATGATVWISWYQAALADVFAALAAYGHLLVLAIVGIGIGAAQVESSRTLGRVVVLFVASCLFYQAWAVAMPGTYKFLLALLLFTIVLDYYLAIWIEQAETPVVRKALVVVSLCSNLGILFFFKYAHFAHLTAHALILPAGISFHTFQSLSYTIDVYRKQLRATRSPIQFATFVLFFPQLVAGPIVRAQDLLPQLADLPVLELEKATRGLYRIVVGLFKKIALADTLAISIVDRVFDTPGHFTSIEVLAGVYGYALQIYLDFSAYSDIAIGSAEVLGFDLPENFRTPYRSANLQEFWRRWHISLSTWLRDYLYISLGGSRGSAKRTYLNLFITMVLGGLWHGASWTFVVWGALHGFGLAVTRYFQRDVAQAEGRAVLVRALWVWAGAVVIGLVAVRRYAAVLDTWSYLIIGYVVIAPLWAIATAWLSRDDWKPVPPREVQAFTIETLRVASCIAGAGVLVALQYGEPVTWIALVLVAWGLALAADIEEGGLPPITVVLRRALAVVLTFNYVCLAWIFFRAPTFDGALAVLRQLADGSWGHANVTPLVQAALLIGLVCHFWADGTFRWLRDRFVTAPPIIQGLVLAVAALVLRELSHAKLVKFIYFEF
jgi:D-alanyl-lipoteichoic acid acyltransferase DltB (MBOAT superfamily)